MSLILTFLICIFLPSLTLTGKLSRSKVGNFQKSYPINLSYRKYNRMYLFSIEETTEQKSGSNTAKALDFETGDHTEDSITETCSNLSTIAEDDVMSSTIYENGDSDCSDYDTDDSFQEFKLKDWLKLAKMLVRKRQTTENQSKLLGKLDELEEFFYFFAVEYLTGDGNMTELVSNKRSEFVMTWQDIIGPCDSIFDCLQDSMGDINVENSFRL